MKNSPTEQLIFEEFLKTKGLNSADLIYPGRSLARFNIGDKEVSVLLSEIVGDGSEVQIPGNGFTPNPSAHKIRKSLIHHLKNEFKDQGREVWLFLFTSQSPLNGVGRLNQELPEIELLVVDFLMSKREIDKIIIFETGLKEAALEVSRG